MFVKTQVTVPNVVVQFFGDLSGDVSVDPKVVNPTNDDQWPVFLNLCKPPVEGFLGKLIWNNYKDKSFFIQEVLRLLTCYTTVPKEDIAHIMFVLEKIMPANPVKRNGEKVNSNVR